MSTNDHLHQALSKVKSLFSKPAYIPSPSLSREGDLLFPFLSEGKVDERSEVG